MDRLGRAIRGKIGESLRTVRADPPLAQVTTGSLEALQRFTEGARAYEVEGDYPRAIRLLESAVAIDTTFAMAYRKLALAIRTSATATTRSVDLGRADSALEQAFRFRARLPDAERLALLGSYYSGGPHRDRARAQEAYEALFDRHPEWKTIITQAQLANIYLSRREYARSESLYAEVIRDTPDERDPHFMIAALQINQGKFDAARRSLARARARRISSAILDNYEGYLLYNLGKLDSAGILFRRANQAGLGSLSFLLATEGRLHESLRTWQISRGADTAAGHPIPRLPDEALREIEYSLHYDAPESVARQLDDVIDSIPAEAAPRFRVVRFARRAADRARGAG
jgi:Tfp pilus assembly protein PilF